MKILTMVAAAALVTCSMVPALAQNANAPGQDRVCLVTTEGNVSNGKVLATKWLPRKAAEKQAANNGGFIGTHPAVQTEEGCEAFLANYPQ